MEINQKLDMSVIEEKAINELGMQRPDNSQIVYVNVKQDTYTEISDKASNKEKILKLVKNTVEGIAEYFGAE